MNYEIVIGIEMHVELLTKTKMFSPTPITYGKKPNTSVSVVDMAFPGVLPTVNKQGIVLALRACMGLNMEIDRLLKFDRKNYYYSDLPKGYQITQQFFPIGQKGKVVLDSDKEIRINRLHIEEDTAKQFHGVSETLIDYNRAGNPLVEIVSEPDIKSADEAVEFIEKVSETLKYLNVSNVRMEEGSMRCDVNISLRPYGFEGLGNKVEIKNLNSLNNIAKAIEHESERQAKILNSGGVILEETRRFDETSLTTVLMRVKDESVDYKYFPDPNILPIQLSENFVEDVRANLPELAPVRYQRYLDMDMKEYDAKVIINNKDLSDFFDEVLLHTEEVKMAANWTISEVLGVVNKQQIEITDLKLKAKELAVMINSIVNKDISSKQAKKVFNEIIEGKETKKVISDLGLEVIRDKDRILAFIDKAIENNPQSVEDYKAGRDRALGFLMGQVMKLSQGKVDPGLTNKLIKEQLESML